MQSLKSIFVTLLILGGAFLAYDKYIAPDKDKIVFKPAPAEKHETTTPLTPPPAPAPAAPVPNPAPVMPEPSKPEPANSSEAMASTPPPAMPSIPQAPDVFVPPHIPPVEEATGNWLQIPPSAFPRQVKLLQDVTFKAGFGSTQVKAGARVTVIAAQQGMLTLAPNATSALRSTVRMEATDLKEVLSQAYESWTARRVADARRSWEQRDAKPVVAAPAAPSSLDASGRPQRGVDGAYPLLLASMKSGVVTEITPQNITRWGEPEKGELDGKPCWMISVEFDAVTAFGKFSTAAIARVVNGRVTGWYYKGSGEVVP